MTVYLRPSSALPRASPSALLLSASIPRTAVLSRSYATHSDLGGNSSTQSTPRRRRVGVLSDDGRYEWGELSGREKVARATQQSLNFVVIIAGAVLTVRWILVTVQAYVVASADY